MAAAGNGDRVWIAEGTYIPVAIGGRETTSEDRAISFVIPSGVEVYGGFAGDESDLSERDYPNNQTILSGNIGEETAGDNSFHVVNITGTTANTVLDGLTISDGRADDGNAASSGLGNNDGGGIFGSNNASATIRNSLITNNNASDDGGGLVTGESSSPNIINTVFSDNSADSVGGGIYFQNSDSPNITSSLFFDNASQFGGAIYHDAFNSGIVSFLEITNSTFVNNIAGDGDSLNVNKYSDSDTELIENSIFWNTEGRDNQQIFQFNRFGDSLATINNSIIPGSYEREGSANNIADNPLFFDPENNDFRLQLASPGINAGDNEAINLDQDIENNPRIFNSTVDIGAYEYGVLMNIADVTIEEGDAETTNAVFEVTLLDSLGNPPNEEITVNYTTVDDSAVAGSDFTATAGTLTFNVGESVQRISVPVTGDEIIESTERFFVELSGVTGNAAIVDGQAIGTITNDDIPKEISIGDIAVAEGNEAETAFVFTLSLNEPYVENITVDYNTVENNATAGDDFIAIDGTVTFEPGETEKTVSVLVNKVTSVTIRWSLPSLSMQPPKTPSPSTTAP